MIVQQIFQVCLELCHRFVADAHRHGEVGARAAQSTLTEIFRLAAGLGSQTRYLPLGRRSSFGIQNDDFPYRIEQGARVGLLQRNELRQRSSEGSVLVPERGVRSNHARIDRRRRPASHQVHGAPQSSEKSALHGQLRCIRLPHILPALRLITCISFVGQTAAPSLTVAGVDQTVPDQC